MSGKEDKIRILVVDDLHPSFMEKLHPTAFEITYTPEIKSSQINAALLDKDALVVRSKAFIDRDICTGAEQLKLIARAGAGMDNIDLEWCREKGITVLHASGANSNAVGEQALGMLLNLMSNISKSDREIRANVWDREGNRGEELSGKTVGIIGYGNTGSAFARVLGGFKVKILAYDKYKTSFGNNKVSEVKMETIFKEADIVSLHIPLTHETRHLVNADYLQAFDKPIRLLNLSRGKIVNTKDVVEALMKKKIISFGTDVLENEELDKLNHEEQKIFNDLKGFSNVILTPHIGGWSKESYKNISENLANQLIEFYNKKLPLAKGFTEAQKFP